MAELLNPLVRVTAHFFIDELAESRRVSRWYTREIDESYSVMRDAIEFNLYEPDAGEIDLDTSYQILLKGIAVVPAESTWWSSFINEMFRDRIEGEYLDWLILTNMKLKNLRKGIAKHAGNVAFTFISINDGETIKAEFEEEDPPQY